MKRGEIATATLIKVTFSEGHHSFDFIYTVKNPDLEWHGDLKTWRKKRDIQDRIAILDVKRYFKKCHEPKEIFRNIEKIQ